MSEDIQYFCGAIPSPPNVLAAAVPHLLDPSIAVPSSFGVVPPKLSTWGNTRFGCCVTSEEAFAKAAYSVLYGSGTQLFVPDDVMIEWARTHRVLNGATLTGVMDDMARTGFGVNGQMYTDGSYNSVDWHDDATLASAIYQGPVKIGVASAQLSRAHKFANGWIASGFHRDPFLNHCVSLCGYGTGSELAAMLGVQAPAGIASTRCYLLFTWGSIGIIDAASMQAITGEAWLRTPTTPQTPVTPPGPTPPPVVPPVNPSEIPTPITVVFGPWNLTISASPRTQPPPAAEV